MVRFPKIWFENLNELIKFNSIIPTEKSDFTEKLNCITRIVVIISLILWLLDFKNVSYFLFFSLLFIVFIYYLEKYKMNTECYKNIIIENYEAETISCPKITSSITLKPYKIPDFKPCLNNPFCGKEKIYEQGRDEISLNQKLASGEGRTSGVVPLSVPPSLDLDSWKENNFVTLSVLNTPRVQEDIYLSGYYTGKTERETETETVQIRENFNYGRGDYNEKHCEHPIKAPVPVSLLPNYTKIVRQGEEVRENFNYGRGDYNEKHCERPIKAPVPVSLLPNYPKIVRQGEEVRENFSYEKQDKKQDETENYFLRKTNYTSGLNNDLLNISYGYEEENLNFNLPVNMRFGEGQKNFKEHNKNIFTSNISSDNFTLNQIIEPINSNIGISFTQQFQPMDIERKNDNLFYTLKDPYSFGSDNIEIKENIYPDEANVYDPRFSGYGTSYRSYLEPMTGQTRFFYDDINSVRMPNYITRNKIDNMSREYSLNEVKELAHEKWNNDSSCFRDDLQERLMRKVNSAAWQKKMFPNSSRPVGSYAKYKK